MNRERLAFLMCMDIRVTVPFSDWDVGVSSFSDWVSQLVSVESVRFCNQKSEIPQKCSSEVYGSVTS